MELKPKKEKRETGVAKNFFNNHCQENEKTSHKLGENITKDVTDKIYPKLLKLNNKKTNNPI